jgi:hypothetical protein
VATNGAGRRRRRAGMAPSQPQARPRRPRTLCTTSSTSRLELSSSMRLKSLEGANGAVTPTPCSALRGGVARTQSRRAGAGQETRTGCHGGVAKKGDARWGVMKCAWCARPPCNPSNPQPPTPPSPPPLEAHRALQLEARQPQHQLLPRPPRRAEHPRLRCKAGHKGAAPAGRAGVGQQSNRRELPPLVGQPHRLVLPLGARVACLALLWGWGWGVVGGVGGGVSGRVEEGWGGSWAYPSSVRVRNESPNPKIPVFETQSFEFERARAPPHHSELLVHHGHAHGGAARRQRERRRRRCGLVERELPRALSCRVGGGGVGVWLRSDGAGGGWLRQAGKGSAAYHHAAPGLRKAPPPASPPGPLATPPPHTHAHLEIDSRHQDRHRARHHAGVDEVLDQPAGLVAGGGGWLGTGLVFVGWGGVREQERGRRAGLRAARGARGESAAPPPLPPLLLPPPPPPPPPSPPRGRAPPKDPPSRPHAPDPVVDGGRAGERVRARPQLLLRRLQVARLELQRRLGPHAGGDRQRQRRGAWGWGDGSGGSAGVSGPPPAWARGCRFVPAPRTPLLSGSPVPPSPRSVAPPLTLLVAALGGALVQSRQQR